MNRPSPAELHDFDELPAAALVRLPVVAALLSVSGSTVWRWCRAGKLPQPANFGGVALWNVGELRKAFKIRLGQDEPPLEPSTNGAAADHLDTSA